MAISVAAPPSVHGLALIPDPYALLAFLDLRRDSGPTSLYGKGSRRSLQDLSACLRKYPALVRRIMHGLTCLTAAYREHGDYELLRRRCNYPLRRLRFRPECTFQTHDAGYAHAQLDFGHQDDWGLNLRPDPTTHTA